MSLCYLTVPVVHDSKPACTIQSGPGTPECITLHLCFCQDLCQKHWERVWIIIQMLQAEELWCIYQKKKGKTKADKGQNLGVSPEHVVPIGS